MYFAFCILLMRTFCICRNATTNGATDGWTYGPDGSHDGCNADETTHDVWPSEATEELTRCVFVCSVNTSECVRIESLQQLFENSSRLLCMSNELTIIICKVCVSEISLLEDQNPSDSSHRECLFYSQRFQVSVELGRIFVLFVFTFAGLFE